MSTAQALNNNTVFIQIILLYTGTHLCHNAATWSGSLVYCMMLIYAEIDWHVHQFQTCWVLLFVCFYFSVAFRFWIWNSCCLVPQRENSRTQMYLFSGEKGQDSFLFNIKFEQFCDSVIKNCINLISYSSWDSCRNWFIN